MKARFSGTVLSSKRTYKKASPFFDTNDSDGDIDYDIEMLFRKKIYDPNESDELSFEDRSEDMNSRNEEIDEYRRIYGPYINEETSEKRKRWYNISESDDDFSYSFRLSRRKSKGRRRSSSADESYTSYTYTSRNQDDDDIISESERLRQLRKERKERRDAEYGRLSPKEHAKQWDPLMDVSESTSKTTEEEIYQPKKKKYTDEELRQQKEYWRKRQERLDRLRKEIEEEYNNKKKIRNQPGHKQRTKEEYRKSQLVDDEENEFLKGTSKKLNQNKYLAGIENDSPAKRSHRINNDSLQKQFVASKYFIEEEKEEENHEEEEKLELSFSSVSVAKPKTTSPKKDKQKTKKNNFLTPKKTDKKSEKSLFDSTTSSESKPVAKTPSFGKNKYLQIDSDDENGFDDFKPIFRPIKEQQKRRMEDAKQFHKAVEKTPKKRVKVVKQQED